MTSTPAGTPGDPETMPAAPEPAPAKPPAKRRAPRAKAAADPAAADATTTSPAAVAATDAVDRTDQAPATGADDAAAEAVPTAKRPGLPYREPGRVRRRRMATPEDGTGIVDPGAPDPEALAMARRIVELAEDKKAADILLLDVRALTAVTDYFIICSGASERQLGAIADGIAEGLKETGVLPLGREGGANAHWVLLDFGAAIVHVMAPPEREYYQLEQLWADATILLRVL